MVLLMVPSHSFSLFLMVCIDENRLSDIFLLTAPNMSDRHLILFPPNMVTSATQSEVLSSSPSLANHLCSLLMSSASSKAVQASFIWPLNTKRAPAGMIDPHSCEVSRKKSNNFWMKILFFMRDACKWTEHHIADLHSCLSWTSCSSVLQRCRKKKILPIHFIVALWNHVGVRTFDLLLPSVAGLCQELYKNWCFVLLAKDLNSPHRVPNLQLKQVKCWTRLCWGPYIFNLHCSLWSWWV